MEQKLTEFHGIFSDARLPPRKSVSAARSLEFLESIKGDFGHFLRVSRSFLICLIILFSSSFRSIYYRNLRSVTVNFFTIFSLNPMISHYLMVKLFSVSFFVMIFPYEFNVFILAKMFKVVPRRLRIEVKLFRSSIDCRLFLVERTIFGTLSYFTFELC